MIALLTVLPVGAAFVIKDSWRVDTDSEMKLFGEVKGPVLICFTTNCKHTYHKLFDFAVRQCGLEGMLASWNHSRPFSQW